ncbi:MAG: FHA domain-containing protein, partial [Acidimicrobiia bacterium]
MAEGQLRVSAGDQHVVLPADREASIGRDRSSTIIVDEDGVSRRHARLFHRNGRWVLEDAGSRNGTYLDGATVTQIEIRSRTTVLLGHPRYGTSVTLEPLTAARPDAPSGPPPRPEASPPPSGPPGGSPPPPAQRKEAAPPRPAQREEAAPPRPARPRPGGAPVHTDVGPSVLSVGDFRQVSQVHRPQALVRIGRAPDNEVVVDDLTVSRHHAELRGDAATGYELSDLGSFNGTFVNGVQIQRALVKENDVVGIGHHRLRLVAGRLEEYVDTGDILFEVTGLAVTIEGGQRILDDVSFSLPERSLLAVVGPSGAGKSTLLNALTGFRPAPIGSVLYDGRDLYASYADLRQRIGYVPQDDILHPELTIRQALDYAAKLRFPPEVTAQERSQRVSEVLEELGLSHRAGLAISKLSGGQRKRCSVAIELLTKPSLLFLDEPTSGLDPGYERSLTKLLRDLADGGRTVVVVTHSVQSLDLCDRLLVLAPGGRLAYFGPPGESLGYFEEPNYAGVFEALEQGSADDWAARFRHGPLYARFVADPLAQREIDPDLGREVAARPPKRPGWLSQFTTLTSRYVTVIMSDRKLVLGLLLQAPILGVLMLAALSEGELAPLGPNELTRFSQAMSVLIVLVIGVTGLGISNAVREIVKEGAIFRRERSVGLSISAYVLSKVFVLSILTFLQAAVMVLIAMRRQGSGWGGALLESGEIEFVIGFGMAGLAGMGLGLLISAIAKNVDRAVSLLPVLLVLQLIVSGAFKNVLEKPVLREASYLASAQWGFSAGAATIDLNELQALNDCLQANTTISNGAEVSALLDCSLLERATAGGSTAELERALLGFGVSQAEIDGLMRELQGTNRAQLQLSDDPPLRFWDQTPGDWLANIAVLGAFIVVQIGGAMYALRRKD